MSQFYQRYGHMFEDEGDVLTMLHLLVQDKCKT